MTDPAEAVDITSPIAWQRWLSIQLVRLRKAAGVKQADAARAIGASVGKLSYLENGDRPISVDELEGLLDHYDVEATARAPLRRAAVRASERGWWEAWADDELETVGRRYVGMEDAASRLREYVPTVVQGLLQTPAYARAVIVGAKPHIPPEVVQRQVDLRLRRQAALSRATRPLVLDVVLDEATLHRQVGGVGVLREQLKHLLVTSERHSNVTLRVVPYSAGSHPAMFGPFALLDFDWSGEPGLIFVEDVRQAEFIDDRAQYYEYSSRFEALSSVCLAPGQSANLIQRLIKELS